MTVPTDPENNNYTTVETDATTREFTSDTSIVYGQLTVRDTHSPYGTENDPVSASTFTSIVHGSVQEYATKGSTVMDVHPVLMQLDPTGVIDPSGLTMTFSMYSDESEEPLHFENKTLTFHVLLRGPVIEFENAVANRKRTLRSPFSIACLFRQFVI